MYQNRNFSENVLKSIYVVEDDLPMSALIKGILEKEGYDVKVFANLKSILPCYKKNKPDILIMDINLPEGKYAGIQFLRHIQKETPSIMITGYDNIHTRTESAIYGAKSYLKKPFNPFDLVNRVQNTLR